MSYVKTITIHLLAARVEKLEKRVLALEQALAQKDPCQMCDGFGTILDDVTQEVLFFCTTCDGTGRQ